MTIKAFNSHAEELVWLNKNQPKFERGRNILDYVETGRRSYFTAAIEKVFKGELVEYDRRYRPDAANFQWILFTPTPVYEDHLICGVCITGRDVTVRKLYLKNLEDQNRTFREISWTQSHLVRAPLARIMGLTDLLKTARDEDFEKTVEYIILSARDLDAIINKITEQSNGIITKYPVPNPNTLQSDERRIKAW